VTSWTRSIVPLLVSLAVTLGLVLLARKWGDELGTWARQPSIAWAIMGLAGYVATALLAVRSFPLLRDARLFALSLLLVPLGVTQFLHGTRLFEERPPGWLGEELQKSAPGFIERLDSHTVLLLPVAVLCAVAVPGALTVRTLRLVSAGLTASLVLVGALLAGLVGGFPDLPYAGGVHVALCVVAGVTALAAWRSDGGLGGAIAGACALAMVAGLAQLEVGFTPALEWLYRQQWGVIDLDDVAVGELPYGTDRLLLLVLPLGLVVVVAREWIVNLSHRTSMDMLTRLYNKDYAKSIVEQTGMCDLGTCFSVAVADIDFFKKVNDTHGHGAGDVVLHEVAAGIREAVGARGVVCRTGGEEITIFFPFLGLPEAKEACERLRKAVEKLKIKIVNNEGRKQKISVTLSVGVATNQDTKGKRVHSGVSDVVQAADRAVYQAKQRGRNRVVTMEE
jgi:diguanylate cyclase (GGDEF)-like protein